MHGLAALGLFGLSLAGFERFTRESHASTRLAKAITDTFGARKRSGTNRAWSRALAWKDFYFIAGGVKSIAMRLLLYVAIIGIIAAIAIPNLLASRRASTI